MNDDAERRAKEFLENEKEFHLGFLPTEQSNPKTRDLDSHFKRSSEEGVKLLLSVDREIVPMARRVLASEAFAKMEASMADSIASGRKLVFSGCGATGRLSILLEAMWRRALLDLRESGSESYSRLSKYQDSVSSIMTGGDFALVRSVESFEDYAEFGRQQVREASLGRGDTLVAITEGGETSSVLGTAAEAADRGASVFLLFNNPASLLRDRLERCRRAIDDPRVTVLDLYCCSMAVAGSTRMQATSSEQLVAGAALEGAFQKVLRKEFPCSAPSGLSMERVDWASAFDSLLDDLNAIEAMKAVSSQIEFEEGLYRAKGLVTYYASRALLDIFTDTTERAPTFMLPPFRKAGDLRSPPSWAFVKNPVLPTSDAWRFALSREPRCLSWTAADYERMDAGERIRANPPKLDSQELMKFQIGCEEDPSRVAAAGTCAAAMIVFGDEAFGSRFSAFSKAFENASAKYSSRRLLAVGGELPVEGFSHIPARSVRSPLRLLDRLAMKLVLNCISTGSMVRLGRVAGNWMSFVEVSNKKLVDRSVRLISELCGLDYERACRELFKTLDELERTAKPGGERVSPVQGTLARLGRRREEGSNSFAVFKE